MHHADSFIAIAEPNYGKSLFGGVPRRTPLGKDPRSVAIKAASDSVFSQDWVSFRVPTSVGDQADDEMVPHRQPKCLLLPHSPVRVCWDLLGTSSVQDPSSLLTAVIVSAFQLVVAVVSPVARTYDCIL